MVAQNSISIEAMGRTCSIKLEETRGNFSGEYGSAGWAEIRREESASIDMKEVVHALGAANRMATRGVHEIVLPWLLANIAQLWPIFREAQSFARGLAAGLELPPKNWR